MNNSGNRQPLSVHSRGRWSYNEMADLFMQRFGTSIVCDSWLMRKYFFQMEQGWDMRRENFCFRWWADDQVGSTVEITILKVLFAFRDIAVRPQQLFYSSQFWTNPRQKSNSDEFHFLPLYKKYILYYFMQKSWHFVFMVFSRLLLTHFSRAPTLSIRASVRGKETTSNTVVFDATANARCAQQECTSATTENRDVDNVYFNSFNWTGSEFVWFANERYGRVEKWMGMKSIVYITTRTITWQNTQTFYINRVTSRRQQAELIRERQFFLSRKNSKIQDVSPIFVLLDVFQTFTFGINSKNTKYRRTFFHWISGQLCSHFCCISTYIWIHYLCIFSAFSFSIRYSYSSLALCASAFQIIFPYSKHFAIY